MMKNKKMSFAKFSLIIIVLTLLCAVASYSVKGASIEFAEGKTDKDILSGKIVTDKVIGLTTFESLKVQKIPYYVLEPTYKEVCTKINQNGTQVDDCISVFDKYKNVTYYKSATLTFNNCIENKYYNIYKSNTFYTNPEDIIKNGFVYTNIQCKDNKLSFDVDSFSAYTYGASGHSWFRDFTNTSIVYIKLNLTAGTTYKFNIKNTSTYAQNPKDVFIFYDDFESGIGDWTIDLYWTNATCSGRTTKCLYASDLTNYHRGNAIYNKLNYSKINTTYVMGYYPQTHTSGNMYIADATYTTYGSYTYAGTNTNNYYVGYNNSGVSGASITNGYQLLEYTNYQNATNTTLNTKNKNETTGVLIGESNRTFGLSYNTTNQTIIFFDTNAGDQVNYIDYIYSKKYTATPPTISCVLNYCNITSTINLTDYQVPLITTYTTGDINITDLPNLDFNFTSQTPSNINSINVLNNTNLNINYSIAGDLNTTSPLLFYKTNNSLQDNIIYINGTESGGWHNTSYYSNNGENYTFRLYDGQVYPATYNRIDLDTIQNTNFYNNSINGYLSIELINVSNAKEYGFFEFYANGTGNNRVYYCNSSYLFNSNVALSSNCVLLATIDGDSYNHYHLNSSHLLVPFIVNTTTGKIGNVGVTEKSYFMIRDATKFYGLANETRNDITQYSTNSGLAWTTLPYTLNAHLHQYLGNSIFYYYTSAIILSNGIRTNSQEVKSDIIDLIGIPPQAPIIILPNASIYSDNLLISYYQAVASNATIQYYNISIINNNSLSETLIFNQTSNLTETFNTNIIADGYYYIKVLALDSNNLSSFSISEVFEIDNTLPTITFISPTPSDLGTISTDYVIINQTTNEKNYKNTTYNIYFSTGLLYDTNFSTIQNSSKTFSGLIAGASYYFNVTACDVIDNCNTSQTRYFTYSTTSTGGNGTTNVYFNNSFNATLQSGQCPTNSGGISILWIFLVVAGFLILIGLAMQKGLFGILGSFIVIFLSFFIYGCTPWLAGLLIAIGGVMITYFGTRVNFL